MDADTSTLTPLALLRYLNHLPADYHFTNSYAFHLLDSLIAASENPDQSILLELAKSAAREANLPALQFCLHNLSITPTKLIIPALSSTDSPAAVGALLKAGFDPNYCVPGHSGTSLCLASLVAKLPLIRFLLASGADPNPRNVGYGRDSLKPLACCAAGWQVDSDAAAAMKVLMDEGGAEWSGSGALQVSAQFGREECVKVLVERGADVEECVARVEGGKSAIVLAREGGHEGIVAILRANGARD